MIGPLVLPLPLPLALSLLLTVAIIAPSATSVTQNRSRCDITQYGKDDSSEGERWVTVEGARRAVVFEWSSAAERAAAALLASALRLAGYRSTRLRRGRMPLANRSYLPYDESEVVVMLAARWTPGDVWSGWLQAVGATVVPVAPRLHRRTPYTLTHTHISCTSPTHELNKFYVAREWKHFMNRTQFNESIPVARTELLERIRSNDSEAFTFLDVEVWGDEPNVEVVGAVADGSARALSVVDGALWRYSPALWHLLSQFEPRSSDLRHLLTLAALDSPDSLDRPEDPMVAVCEWAAISTRLLDQLHTWAGKTDSLRYVHYAFVFLCTDDADGSENDTIQEYIDFLETLQKELNLDKHCVDLEVIVAKCDDDGTVAKYITDMIQTEKFYRTIGVIGPGRVFGNVTELAERRRLTLMSYSAVSEGTVGAVGGRPGAAARALRDLLAACGWTRLAVLSDSGPAATELSAALRAAIDLNLKFVPLTSSRAAIRDVLKSLKSSDARVFLVNAGALLAREVMLVAAELGLTAHAGRVWLAREWVGTGAGEAPYELTFAWRGGDGDSAAADGDDAAADGDGAAADVAGAARPPLRSSLRERWARRGSWPLYAAPLADAVLALGEGYKNMFRVYRNLYDDVHSDDTFRTYWNYMKTEVNISRGVVQELRFKDRELRSPRVFLYRWNGTRAALVSEWRVGAGAGAMCPLALVSLSDGSRSCTVPVGDRFDQRCGDMWLIAGVLALTALVPMLLMAAMAARRALRARDAHLVKRAEEMLEARWRAKASRLEPYFVERRALKLREQVGAGRFGRVWLGFLREAGAGAGAVAVAAKALREDAAPVEETEFFREARALAALQHENVVRFVGVCVTDGPPLLLMEYAFFGDLLRYLRARRHLAASDSPEAAQVSAAALTRFARQAATALAYLARRGYVHRDVRAANCLVDERRNLKLADFGMARATRPTAEDGDGYGDGEYTSRRRALFPVLWMAPESLSRGVFSAASDVWALGVLVLELVTLGARPYGALSPLQVHHYVVREGRRPPLPRELGSEARTALLACWRRAPGARPPARSLAAWLAARPCALAPTPLAAADDRAEDADSGIGAGDPPPHFLRSSCIDDIGLYDDDLSFS